MGVDAVDHRRGLTVLACDLDPELDVGAFGVVGEDFADVVQQPAPLGQRRIQMQFCGHHPREPGHFLRVVEDVLTVGGPVSHPAYQLDQLGMKTMDARVVRGLLAQLDQLRLQLALALDYDLFDAARMNPAVGDERLERATRDLAADRIEARDDDRIGRVVDDDVHAGRGLERTNVSAFAPDDPAFHLVARERDGRDGGLGRVLGRKPLSRHRDDPLGVALRGATGLLLDVARQGACLGSRLIFYPLEDLPARVVGREPGDPLEPAPLLLDQLVGLRLASPQVELALGQRLFLKPELSLLTRDVLQLPLQCPAAILHPPLGPLPLLPASLDLAIELFAELERFHLPRHHPGIESRFSFAGRTGLDPRRLAARLGQDSPTLAALNPGAHQVDQKRNDQPDHEPDDHEHGSVQLRKYADQVGAHSGTETVPEDRCPRLAGGRRRAKSSAMAAMRVAISRSPRRAWNSSSVIARAARMAAL